MCGDLCVVLGGDEGPVPIAACDHHVFPGSRCTVYIMIHIGEGQGVYLEALPTPWASSFLPH